MAGTLLGAKSAEIDRNFAQALKLEPNNPGFRTIYAMTLLDIDADNAARAATILNGVGAMPASDGFDALLRAQGSQLAVALKAGDARAAQALARRLQAFGTLA
jgi:thioredoxin-like negative regulator of GroEL